MSYLEMLLRRRHHRNSHADPKIAIPLFLAIGAVILFDRMVKKYAPDMNEKFKNALAVVIAVAVVLLCILIMGAGSSE